MRATLFRRMAQTVLHLGASLLKQRSVAMSLYKYGLGQSGTGYITLIPW